jgi:hypothetical protein
MVGSFVAYVRQTAYYDRILGAMALALLAGAATSLHPAVALPVGLQGGAVVATLFLYHALFRNPPELALTRRTAGAFVWHCLLLAQLFLN